MNRGVLVLLATVFFSLGAFWGVYHMATRPAKAMLAQSDCGLEWLQKEYHLTGVQFARIQALSQDYRPGCARRCEQIAIANAKVRALTASGNTVTPEIEAALKEWALLENDCRQAMLSHVYAVSAEMSPEEGRRYLKMATAAILGDTHEHTAMMAHAEGPVSSNP